MTFRTALVLGLLFAPACTCGKAPEASSDDAGPAPDAAVAERDAAAAEPGGLSAPIAAVRVDGGDVVVAGLDVPAKAIRVQRIGANDEVKSERTVLDGLKWSSDADVKLVAAGKGAGITWRGLRNGKLVRQFVVLGPDLAPQGAPIDVTAASCATQDAVWFTDGKKAFSRPWTGASSKTTIPGEADVSLVCGMHRAYAVLDEDDGASFVALGGGAGGDAGVDAGAGAGADAGAPARGKTRLFEESAFGEDDQRERAEYTVGDDLGVVRLATSGALAVREVRGGAPGPIRKLHTTLPKDADVVFVDASPRIIVVVYTDDATDACGDAGAGAPTGAAATKVSALRIDRTGDAEDTIELAPGTCGREVGPFFTGAIGDGISVAWVERVPVVGQSRAPIAGLAHRLVPAQGAAPPLARVEQPADALVDAGCDGTRCFAVALARKTGMDAMVPGIARVLRYP